MTTNGKITKGITKEDGSYYAEWECDELQEMNMFLGKPEEPRRYFVYAMGRRLIKLKDGKAFRTPIRWGWSSGGGFWCNAATPEEAFEHFKKTMSHFGSGKGKDKKATAELLAGADVKMLKNG